MKFVDWKELPKQPFAPLAETVYKADCEGSVLLKNDGNVLPIKKDSVVSLFGRTQIEYYKSGTGSGGLVNAPYVINILDGILNCDCLKLNMQLVDVYKKWLEENPFDEGNGWATEPWSQIEMVPDEETVKSARMCSDTAVIVLGRTAGEDRDNAAEKGSWYLADNEEKLLEIVSKHFEKTVVLLNTGNVIDMKWVEKYNIKAVMYVWHGGQEGGRAVADLMCGKAVPCGKLADTVAKDISLDPSTRNFGDEFKDYYEENIYVGYRYFETFAKDDVLYPFGFGLSYTEFETTVGKIDVADSMVTVNATVKNIGNYAGREVVQVYYEAPQGKLGKPLRQLAAFVKTKEISPGKEEEVSVKFNVADMSSYDDSGETGNKSCYVLESGDYNIYVGNSVRDAKLSHTYTVSDLTVVLKCTEALAPCEQLKIMYPQFKDGKYIPAYKNASMRTVDYNKRISDNLPKDIEYTGDRDITLNDVKFGTNTMDEFVAQLSDEALTYIVKGEGMSSPKVRPGSAGAFGGLTKEVKSYGVPPVSMHDGPSGIRMDSGEIATSMANGAVIASTWDVELTEELAENLSVELCVYNVDSILGPGINIHRNLLNGRNFEYYSEDPVLTGRIAAAYIKGVGSYGNSATVKHFFANSQELGRRGVDSVMSERAAREIYLKAFEIAIKNGNATSVMTSYNKVNGKYTVNDYELNTVVLRNEWGYDGLVTSDWWPDIVNKETGVINLADMVIAQNDIYMPTTDALTCNDNLLDSLKNGIVTRGQLQRNTKNILKYIMNSNSFERFVENGCKVVDAFTDKFDDFASVAVIENLVAEKEYEINFNGGGEYIAAVDYVSDEPEQFQIRVGIHFEDGKVDGFAVNGSKGIKRKFYYNTNVPQSIQKVRFTFPSSKIHIEKIEIRG